MGTRALTVHPSYGFSDMKISVMTSIGMMEGQQELRVTYVERREKELTSYDVE